MASLKLGPSESSQRVNEWSHKDQSKILQIRISHDSGPDQPASRRIRSLQLVYLEDGQLSLSDVLGEGDFRGRSFHAIKVDYPGEYITGVEGDYSPGNMCRLSSLIIETNRNKHGPFGLPSKARSFSFNFGPDNVFGGFHGTHDGAGVTAIGVYLNPPVFGPPPAAGPGLYPRCLRHEPEGDDDRDDNQVPLCRLI